MSVPVSRYVVDGDAASSEDCSWPLVRFLLFGVPGVADEGLSTREDMRDSISSRLALLPRSGEGAANYLQVSRLYRLCNHEHQHTSEASRLCRLVLNSFWRNSRCFFSSASLAFFARISSLRAWMVDILLFCG